VVGHRPPHDPPGAGVDHDGEVEEPAADLGLDVVAPYRVVDSENRAINGSALVRQFGSSAGALVLDVASTTQSETAAATRLGFFVAQVKAEAYASYDRDLFVDTLNDWGWFGPERDRPTWITGEAWT
jgi:hypothetical protein